MSSFPGFRGIGRELNPEPLTIRAGDSLAWARDFADYQPGQGWTLAYVLNSPTARLVVAPADITPLGNTFQVSIPGSETRTWAPGRYQWLAVVSDAAGTRKTVALGRVTVEYDLLDATAPQDTRSKAEVALDAIDAMLAGRATDGVQEYKIFDRELRRYSMDELLQLHAHFTRVVRQQREDGMEYVPPTTVAVRF